MINPKLRIFALATMGATFQAGAADLLETYHAARNQDAVFGAARAAQRAGHEKLPQGRSLLLPNVNLTANNTYNDTAIQYHSATPAANNQYNNHGYGMTLVQPLFNQPKWMSYSESKVQVEQTDAQFSNAEQDLILRVAQAYFDVLLAQDSVQLAGAQKTAITEQLQQAKRNFEVGTSTITDTHEAQARYDLTSAQEIAARNNLEISKRALQLLTNTVVGELHPLGQQFQLEEPQPVNMEQWVDEAQQHNRQVAIVQAAAELARQEVQRSYAGNYPTVDLVANYSKNYANGSSLGVASDNRATSVGVQLNFALYQGGAIASRQREAEANLERAAEELESARRNAALQTRQAYLSVVNGIAQIKALQQALVSSESLLQASKLGQEVGVRTNLDVLNAQQQLYSTRRDLYQAEYGFLINRLKLKAAAGTLIEDDLALINRALY